MGWLKGHELSMAAILGEGDWKRERANSLSKRLLPSDGVNSSVQRGEKGREIIRRRPIQCLDNPWVWRKTPFQAMNCWRNG